MQFVPENLHWQALMWWLVVLSVGVLLKHHYSIATAADLEWMLRPLSLMLERFSGHAFYRDSNDEWVSASADVRLVKACAGINFMIMSFMAYAWVLRPDQRKDTDLLPRMTGRILVLCAAVIAAWVTSLLANSLRISVAMAVSSHNAELHRLIGMLIYVPLLSLQLALGNRSGARQILAGPVLMYLLLMVAVPLLTGNAFQNPALFMNHLLYTLAMIAVMGGIYLLCRRLPLRI